MNRQMWSHAATQDNCALLEKRGVQFVGPGSGSQACGETGPGRMAEPGEIVDFLFGASTLDMAGLRVLVTAGPTYEDIDPVRFIGNRSSGRMGFAIARAAAEAGASVRLVAGPVGLETPAGVERTDVRGAVEMRDTVMGLVDSADVFISVAAVADYTPLRPAAQKIKKGLPRQKLELVGTPDIVAEVAALQDGPFTVGFAAETEKLREHALEKLSRKRLDIIAANRVGEPGTGFESEENDILLLSAGGEKPLGKGNKQQLARKLISEVAARIKGTETIESRSDKDTRPASGN
jgi:phosphopantothenoylcysteine decarboxylase/phosphopantothenate--cysteine ligase